MRPDIQQDSKAEQCQHCRRTTHDTAGDLIHTPECPCRTNVWVAVQRMVCELCKEWIKKGDKFRWIPMLPEDIWFSTEDLVLKQATGMMSVCMGCCTPTLAYSAPDEYEDEWPDLG